MAHADATENPLNAQGFLDALWPDVHVAGPGRIQIWDRVSKRTHFLSNPGEVGTFTGRPDIYTGVGLAPMDHQGPHRARSDQVTHLAGVWADIDVGKKYAADTKAATDLAYCYLPPSVYVLSGSGGIQAWWLTTDEQIDLPEAWQKLHRYSVLHAVDSTHDFARVMRLPDTLNAKCGQWVRAFRTGPYYKEQELWDQIANTPVHVRLRIEDHKFNATWLHKRRLKDESLSGYDLALASLAHGYGCLDDQVAEVVVEHRLAYGDAEKAHREDYIERTVRKAGGQVLDRLEVDRARGLSKPAATLGPPRMRGTYTPGEWANVARKGLKNPENRNLIVPSPFTKLNEGMGGGLRPGQLAVVAGYTSHGKSVFVDQWADAAAKSGKSVHLYLTEMTAYERSLRYVARHANAPFKDLVSWNVDDADWESIELALEKLPYGCTIWTGETLNEVCEHIKASKWDLVILDLIHGFPYADERELSNLISIAERTARASTLGNDGGNGTSIIVVAHLNSSQFKDQVNAARPRPGLQSLKGASTLNQNPDVIVFVWQEDDQNGRPSGQGDIWTAKSRQSRLGGVKVRLDMDSLLFEER